MKNLSYQTVRDGMGWRADARKHTFRFKLLFFKEIV
jgi:hypothetical protein